MLAYVFGYASLVAVPEPGALPGRLCGYRRRWGAAMNNWEGGDEAKHWLDRETGERPRIRVAYLDVYEQGGSAVNGLALPVDAARLAALDAREVNYERIDVSEAFEPVVPPAGTDPASRVGTDPASRVGTDLASRVGTDPASRVGTDPASRVYTYIGLEAACERCRQGAADGDAFVSRDYAAAVRLAFERLGPDALEEFNRTTDPLPFPERDLQVVLPP